MYLPSINYQHSAGCCRRASVWGSCPLGEHFARTMRCKLTSHRGACEVQPVSFRENCRKNLFCLGRAGRLRRKWHLMEVWKEVWNSDRLNGCNGSAGTIRRMCSQERPHCSLLGPTTELAAGGSPRSLMLWLNEWVSKGSDTVPMQWGGCTSCVWSRSAATISGIPQQTHVFLTFPPRESKITLCSVTTLPVPENSRPVLPLKVALFITQPQIQSTRLGWVLFSLVSSVPAPRRQDFTIYPGREAARTSAQRQDFLATSPTEPRSLVCPEMQQLNAAATRLEAPHSIH